jgi:1-deoxy-D-xylulose-5-phosphate synthase
MARRYEEPVLLHIFTEKGRGFKPAGEAPTAFHAPSPGGWLREEGDAAPEKKSNGDSQKSFTEHVRNAIERVMSENERVCTITAAMCQGNMLEPIREKFPQRFFDVGICESHAVVFAAGLAKAGMVPIVDIYSTFLQRSYDQLFQEVSLQNLPIVLAIDRAGLAGPDGPTHHGVFDLAYLRPFPNLIIMAPADAHDIEPMIRFAIESGRPVAIRYPKGTASDEPRTGQPLRLGTAEILRTGRDGMVAVCGDLLPLAYEAAKKLGTNLDGLGRVDLGVINARFVKPLDTATILQPLREGKFLITLEEGMLAGGFGSAVLEAACDEGLDTRKLHRMGVPDRYVEHGDRTELLDDLGINVATLVKTCRRIKGF